MTAKLYLPIPRFAKSYVIRKYWLCILFREATLDIRLIQVTKLESFVQNCYPSYLLSTFRDL